MGTENANEKGNSNDEESSENESNCFLPRDVVEVVTRYIPPESSSYNLGNFQITDTVEVESAGTSQTNVDSLKEKQFEVSEVNEQVCDVNENLPVSDGVESENMDVDPGEDRADDTVIVSGEDDCINHGLVNKSLEDVIPSLFEDLRVVQDEGNCPRPGIVPEEGMSEEDDPQSDGVRRSSRQTKPPKKFHYPQLGNPLISVVQSLLQGLSNAFVQSEENSNLIWGNCVMVPGDPLSVLTTQPYACPRTCIRSTGGGCNPG